MTYKDYDILARVYQSGSDLYSLKDNGELDESLDIKIDHDDQEIVWYEVDEMSHIHVNDVDGQPLHFVEIPSIEEAKNRIDLWIEETKDEV